jgi:hypothetical protein
LPAARHGSSVLWASVTTAGPKVTQLGISRSLPLTPAAHGVLHAPTTFQSATPGLTRIGVDPRLRVGRLLLVEEWV